MTARPTVAQTALDQYKSRQKKAQMIVRNRGMSIAQAERHLRPWMAIACITGASLPEIDQVLADIAEISTASGHPLSPGEQRWLAAEEICPRTTWAPILTKARDKAFDDFLASDAEPAFAMAIALQRMCLSLQHDVNGNHIPPWRQPADREQAIAA